MATIDLQQYFNPCSKFFILNFAKYVNVCRIFVAYLIFFSSKFQLPKDRKLKLLQDQPVKKLSKLSSGNRDTRDKYLILWMFEVKLKELYKKFLTNLAEVSKDTIEKTRMKVMSVNLELLVQSPEQEQELLSRYILYTCKIFCEIFRIICFET